MWFTKIKSAFEINNIQVGGVTWRRFGAGSNPRGLQEIPRGLDGLKVAFARVLSGVKALKSVTFEKRSLKGAKLGDQTRFISPVS